MSQAPEDRARTKRRRVLTQIVLSRRGRLVSRFGQNDVKSTTWTPSTPRRAVRPSGHAQHVGIARHTRRHVAGIARRARRTGGRCTNTLSCPIQQVHVCEFAKRSMRRRPSNADRLLPVASCLLTFALALSLRMFWAALPQENAPVAAPMEFSAEAYWDDELLARRTCYTH